MSFINYQIEPIEGNAAMKVVCPHIFDDGVCGRNLCVPPASRLELSAAYAYAAGAPGWRLPVIS